MKISKTIWKGIHNMLLQAYNLTMNKTRRELHFEKYQ